MSSPTSSGLSRLRIAALVAAPVLVFAAGELATTIFVSWMALMSAMGHGSLTEDEARPLWIGGRIMAAVATVGTIWLSERWLVGPRRTRDAARRRLTTRTRIAAALLAMVVPFLLLPTIRAVYQEGEVARARGGSESDRGDAIRDLALRRTDRAYRALHAIAINRSEDAYVRAQAISAMAEYPESKDALIALAGDDAPDIQAAAGGELVRFATDPRAWAVVERLARDERDLVREALLRSLKYWHPPGAEAKQNALLADIARNAPPEEALAAAAELGTSGFETAMAVFQDVSKDDRQRLEAIEVLGKIRDPRATTRLHQVVLGRTEPGFLPASEAQYREAAANAIGRIQGYAPGEELLEPYNLERRAVFQAQEVVKSQQAYAEATGFFDARLACLELPGTCVPGRNPDESFLAPSLTRETRHGYVHRIEPGRGPTAAEVAGRRVSPTSVVAFAYVAVPQVPGRTGIRAICADDAGTFCFTRDGRRPPVRDGRCLVAPAPPATTPDRYVYGAVDRECEAAR
jgi:HEAT repeat protein